MHSSVRSKRSLMGRARLRRLGRAHRTDPPRRAGSGRADRRCKARPRLASAVPPHGVPVPGGGRPRIGRRVLRPADHHHPAKPLAAAQDPDVTPCDPAVATARCDPPGLGVWAAARAGRNLAGAIVDGARGGAATSGHLQAPRPRGEACRARERHPPEPAVPPHLLRGPAPDTRPRSAGEPVQRLARAGPRQRGWSAGCTHTWARSGIARR